MLSIFFTVPIISNLQLSYTQPKVKDEAVIEVSLPSPKVESVEEVKPQPKESVEIKADVGKQVVVKSKKSSGLCTGVTESWKLVSNPEVEGQYIICNSENGQMSTASELNSAQNNYRVSHGLNALSINSDICNIASERAKEVADNFSHDSFEAAIDRSGIQKSAVGENIASGPLTASQFVEWSWDKSLGHRANMLGDWTEGCGGVYDRYAVFIFAK